MSEFVFYNYGGSANHGCEALIRTLSQIFGEYSCTLLSEAVDQDQYYGLDQVLSIQSAKTSFSNLSLAFIKAFFALKIKKNYFPMDVLPYLNPIKKIPKDCIGVSIGGDVYCYEDYKKYILIHDEIRKHTKKTMLIGCSIEPNLLSDVQMLEDLRHFDLITARESITYEALLSAGISNVELIPDSAFTLKANLSTGLNSFFNGNTVGINVSPLIEKKSQRKGIVFDNYLALISDILANTNFNIALIPHVSWEENDDTTVLKKLLTKVGNNERINLIPDCNCMELKGYISQCRLFVGARTHATIAAYSSCIPTLVVGYSVKARGIAKDLFGTDLNYVIPVETLSKQNDLINAFHWLVSHESSIRKKLTDVMPHYIQKVDNLKIIVEKHL